MSVQMVSDMPQMVLDGPRAGVIATRLAQLMGLFVRPEGATIDRRLVGSAISAAARAGLAESVAFRADAREPSDRTILAFLDALRRSPRPAPEIVNLAAIFGYESLGRLVGASEPSLRRYAAENRTAPDPVALRVHFVAQLVSILRGSFNEFGIRRWFERRHPTLGGRTPADLLGFDFDPAEPRAQAAMDAAVQLLW
jgi:uncharacterized protein (DUF2384 family)